MSENVEQLGGKSLTSANLETFSRVTLKSSLRFLRFSFLAFVDAHISAEYLFNLLGEDTLHY